MPEFLQRVLPRRTSDRRTLGRVRLVDLRGNVDSRLRRLREPRGSTRQLDGIVLAFAGLARLWADGAGLALMRELFSGLPRMVLPLSVCPAAPAQGALALECRPGDAETVALLRAIDHAPTRAAVAIERALLAQRGGGCHQRFGATQVELPGVGTLLYLRDGGDTDAQPDADGPRPQWIPATALGPPGHAIKAWDGSRAERPQVEALAAGVARSTERLSRATALFVSHRRALPEGEATHIHSATHVWVPGIDTWQALAERGVWVEGCADGLGFGALETMLCEPLLQLPPRDQWTVLTHADAVEGWPAGDVIATYRHAPRIAPGAAAGAPPGDATHVYWSSSAQFERWRGLLASGVQHACGPGKTYEHLRRAGVQNLQVFPQPAHWRHWLGV